MKNNLAALRKRRGISAAALGVSVGISRQTIYAVEASTYVPNTTVSLRLARALGVTVEEIFELSEPEPRPHKVTPISANLQSGQSVQLCPVDDKIIAAPCAPSAWFLPPGDASLTSSRQAELYDARSDLSNRLLLAGCDPAMAVLARYLQAAGIHLVLTHQNSSQSLSLLKQGRVHIAGTHLRSNNAVISKMFPANSVSVISFAVGEEGLLTACGNPRNIRGVEDLARKDITFVNRETGSGSRTLLDTHLKKLQLNSKNIRGYGHTAPGHLAAAWEVNSNYADCCLATQSAARLFGLHFIPLESVRYDLVLHKRHLRLPAIQTLLDAITHSQFQQSLHRIGGYNTH